jgi:hypothetical protein
LIGSTQEEKREVLVYVRIPVHAGIHQATNERVSPASCSILCKTAKAKTGDDAARLKTEISENWHKLSESTPTDFTAKICIRFRVNEYVYLSEGRTLSFVASHFDFNFPYFFPSSVFDLKSVNI